MTRVSSQAVCRFIRRAQGLPLTGELVTVNTYSQTWFEVFLETRPYTEQEAAFIMRQLPNPPYIDVLDLCCGRGRLTNRLAAQGYRMVGVDLDAEALELARRRAPVPAVYVQSDMRDVAELQGQFDAVLCWWQSFGYFGEETNRSVLEQLSRKLRPGGRLLLDIYNRDFWSHPQGTQDVERGGVTIKVTNKLTGNRLESHLDYGEGRSDTFEWQLYTLGEIWTLASTFNLRSRLSCAECNEAKAVTAESASMQLVFEKV